MHYSHIWWSVSGTKWNTSVQLPMCLIKKEELSHKVRTCYHYSTTLLWEVWVGRFYQAHMAEALSWNNQVDYASACTVWHIPNTSLQKFLVPTKITHKIKANGSVYEQSLFTQLIKKNKRKTWTAVENYRLLISKGRWNKVKIEYSQVLVFFF